MEPIQLMFWLSLLLVAYTYCGYPLSLWMCSKWKNVELLQTEVKPFVSVVMSVMNEEKNLKARLHNLISQDYPADRIEIIVVSDGSDDRTCEMARSVAKDNVNLVMLEQRHGKAFALNQGVARAKGEIVVFADARQRFEPHAISRLVASFGDPRVGCVSGELVLLQDNNSSIGVEMGAYWQYEKWIRKMESQTGSVVGATGAIYAIRRDLYRNLPVSTLLDDVLTPLNIVEQGFLCAFNSYAVAYDDVSKNARQEWRRKVRTLAGNWQLMSLHPEFLLPWRNPCWWRLLSHKCMRLFVPFALIILLVTSCLLSGGFYRTMAGMQLLIYALSFIGALVPRVRSFKIVNMSYFFLVMNAAALGGFWRWVTGGCQTVWQPAVVHGKSG